MTTLKTQLEEKQQAFRAQVPSEALAVMDNATNELKALNITENSIAKGDKAPEFSLKNQNGLEHSLSDIIKKGSVVLSFYRGGWCPYCNIELQALQAILPEIQSLGASLIAITPETPDNSLSTAEKNQLSFDIFNDIGNSVAKNYGLEFTLPEPLRPIYQKFGIDLPAFNGDDSFVLPLAATFVVDTQGIIQYRFVDADYTQRAEPSDILTVLQNL